MWACTFNIWVLGTHNDDVIIICYTGFGRNSKVMKNSLRLSGMVIRDLLEQFVSSFLSQEVSLSMNILAVHNGWSSYLQHDTGLGRTTPAVYTAWNRFCWCTRRVISRINTGATRFDRNFLCTHKKLISTIFFVLKSKNYVTIIAYSSTV